ncbi:hypothetical protein E3N88_33727 [Mikania micrantha]|uniref:NAB domain-containing protein n=1 Tax=Mikania micrantha TaxID=192012 RepID=A0A5N6MCS3_9ASTR|nr:hypothetical protein E3N88_33727 [Mikania micrantha]
MSLVESHYGLLSSESDMDFVHHIALFAALLCACIVFGHLLEESRWINESITALTIGLGTGSIILLTSGGTRSQILEFKQEFFFIYLLPPIIFNAGFQVKKKQFFQNFTTITLFGAIGTLVSFSIISFGATHLFPKLGIDYLDMKDYLALGAIFSATDSVCTLQVLNQEETPLLYSLVFGEGVVNDATSVVLFNAITKFDLSDVNAFIALTFAGNFLSLFVLSTFLGVLVIICTSLTQIHMMHLFRESTDREVSLMILMAYLSYLLAEVFGLSGILTVFFCGIVMSHYAWHNVTINSQVTTKHAFATMSFIAEIFIFMYVGMDALDVGKWKFVKDSPRKSFGASALLLGLIMFGRACFVFPISIISNLITKPTNNKIEFKQQVTVWWAGLMRGAVSVALAYKKFTRSDEQHMKPANALLITSTIIIVLFSTMVFGLLTKPIINFLFHKSSYVDHTQPSSPKSIMMPLIGHRLGVEAEIGDEETTTETITNLKVMFSNPTNAIHYYWRKFDDAFMRPVFGGRGFISYVTEEEEMEMKSKLSAHWWWFDSQSNSIPRKSPWLHSTLAELDEKTEAMLKLIEEDADSFAKRAEMYYKKRPELINIVEDLYRAHRSLAEKYDQVKFEGGNRHLTPWTSCPLPLSKYRSSPLAKESEKSYDSYSESFDFDHDFFDSDDSVVVDDLEQEQEEEDQYTQFDKETKQFKNLDEEKMNLMVEFEKLRQENKILKEQLIQKDEEKKEAIRQLSFSVDFLKQENLNLKSRFARDCFKKQTSSNPFELTKLKGVFWGKFFNGEAAVPL